MSIFRHLLLLSCSPALLLACASRPELAGAKRALVAEAPRFELPVLEPSASNPYAPTRSRNAAVYSWQSEKRAECPPESVAREDELESGSAFRAARSMVGALPDRATGAAGKAQGASPDLVVAALRPALHQCFSRWLDARLDAQGSVRFALELGCTGDVEAISAENQGVNESTLECLFSAVAPARFAPPPGGHATVLVPVVFKNTER